MREHRRMYLIEPFIFLFFGVLNLSRIRAFTDRRGYAAFWLGHLRQQGGFYYVLLVAMTLLGLAGLVLWFKELGYNYWWRWVLFGTGMYTVFNLVAVLFHFWWWEALQLILYDTTSGWWNVIWGVFVLAGAASAALGLYLGWQWFRQRRWRGY